VLVHFSIASSGSSALQFLRMELLGCNSILKAREVEQSGFNLYGFGKPHIEDVQILKTCIVLFCALNNIMSPFPRQY
jgi:hypothetical protein